MYKHMFSMRLWSCGQGLDYIDTTCIPKLFISYYNKLRSMQVTDSHDLNKSNGFKKGLHSKVEEVVYLKLFDTTQEHFPSSFLSLREKRHFEESANPLVSLTS